MRLRKFRANHTVREAALRPMPRRCAVAHHHESEASEPTDAPPAPRVHPVLRADTMWACLNCVIYGIYSGSAACDLW